MHRLYLKSDDIFKKYSDLFDGYTLELKKKSLDNLIKGLTQVRDAIMKAGEAIIFTSCTIHGSHTNQGNERRLALGGRYAGGSVNIYPEDEYVEDGHFHPVVVHLNKAYIQGLKVH